MTAKRAFSTPPRNAPEPLMNLPPFEGVGNAGCPWHPRPRVRFALVKSTLRELDASVGASGPHDFAVRCNISRPLAVDRSQAVKPALQSRRAQNAAASTASHPNVRDDHDTPLFSGRMARTCRYDLPDGESGIFLARALDTKMTRQPDGQISLAFD
jgi:hypothetical protein